MKTKITYNNSLMVCVVNDQTGCEIWEYCASVKLDKIVFNELVKSKILIYF